MKKYKAGLTLSMLGILIMIVGLVLLSLPENTRASFGGCILIGPIPICVGFGSNPLILILLSLVSLAVILVLGYILPQYVEEEK